MEETIARLFQIFIALTVAYSVALWFALAVWTYRDIVSRSTNVVVQIFSTLIVVLFFAPGAIIYLILRPRETLDEAFQRSMEEEYLVQDLEEFPLCPSCRRAIRDDFVFCPHCRVELRSACRQCRRLIDLRWEVCAYCGASQFEPSLPIRAEPAVAGRGAVRAATGSSPFPANGGARAAAPQSFDGGPRRSHWDAEDDPIPLLGPEGPARGADGNGGGVPAPIERAKPAPVRGQDSGWRPDGSGS